MKLSDADLIKLAELAQIELSSEERASLVDSLSTVVGYIDQLGQIDTANTGEMGQITGLANVMQADEIAESVIEREAFLIRAPQREGEFIKVKKIIDKA